MDSAHRALPDSFEHNAVARLILLFDESEYQEIRFLIPALPILDAALEGNVSAAGRIHDPDYSFMTINAHPM